MPFYTTKQNPAGGDSGAMLGNTLARIFVGDPAADAEYKNQQIKNETEYLRQKQIAAQTLNEAVRGKQLEAATAAAYAAANSANATAANKNRENKAYMDLGSEFTKDRTDYAAPGGMSKPGDAPAGTAGKGFDLNNPAVAAGIVSNVMRGGIDPKVLSAAALMPGQDDQTLGRIMTATGDPLGKDEYVSVGDRNTNRRFDVGGNSRLADSEGNVKLGLDPTQELMNTAQANQRNATAGRQNALADAGGGGKVPKLDQKEMDRFMRAALMTRGAPMVDGETYVQPSQYLAPQPEIYADMSRLIDEAYRQSGGRASAVQDALSQYLLNSDFTKFGSKVDNPGLFTGDTIQKIPRPDVEAIIRALAQQQGGIPPEIFTEGGDVPAQPVNLTMPNAPLPNRQNVGNSGWKVLGVQPGGQ